MRFSFCAVCDCKDLADLQHHHWLPKSLGGSDDETNMLTLCSKCLLNRVRIKEYVLWLSHNGWISYIVDNLKEKE